MTMCRSFIVRTRSYPREDVNRKSGANAAIVVLIPFMVIAVGEMCEPYCKMLGFVLTLNTVTTAAIS